MASLEYTTFFLRTNKILHIQKIIFEINGTLRRCIVFYSVFLLLVDGIYGNWTKTLCSVTCGQGVEIWTRQCDNPPGRYGGNCSKEGPSREIGTCKLEACPGKICVQWLIVMMIQFCQNRRVSTKLTIIMQDMDHGV
jgi:hypothetical protein